MNRALPELSRRCDATPEAAAGTGRDAALLPRPYSEKLADVICGILMVLGSLYFFGHVAAAWLRGSFEVSR